jgi:hypothetical protein
MTRHSPVFTEAELQEVRDALSRTEDNPLQSLLEDGWELTDCGGTEDARFLSIQLRNRCSVLTIRLPVNEVKDGKAPPASSGALSMTAWRVTLALWEFAMTYEPIADSEVTVVINASGVPRIS